MNWDGSFVGHILPEMLRALMITLEATLLGSVLAFNIVSIRSRV